MLARIFAISAIWIGAAVAWLILGGTLAARTDATSTAVTSQVSDLWGTAQVQAAPVFSSGQEGGKVIVPSATRLAVDVIGEQRRKGLLWYSTYRVAFAGRYHLDAASRPRKVHLCFTLPVAQATYDNLHVDVQGKTLVTTLTAVAGQNDASGTAPPNLEGQFDVPAGQARDILIAYGSQGLDNWSYRFGDSANSVRNFTMTLHTNVPNFDFPAQTLAATREVRTPDGWDLIWTYRSLVAGYGIGVTLPQRLQPGELAQRITLWAPVSLLFYFFVMFVITTIRRIDLHPMNYFFLTAAFFAFHLLFAYTVDRLDIGVAFAICAAVSLFLNVSYLRLVLGLRFAAVEAGLAQFFYLILFSLALFNEGLSGLAITVGAILTLYVTMQLTASINWNERFGRVTAPA
jgi:hypothetical protein